jgi:hypothetical protein
MKLGFLLPSGIAIALYFAFKQGKVVDALQNLTYKVKDIAYIQPFDFRLNLQMSNLTDTPILIDRLKVDLYLSENGAEGDLLATITQGAFEIKAGISDIALNINIKPSLGVQTIINIVSAIKSKKIDLIADIDINYIGINLRDKQTVNVL